MMLNLKMLLYSLTNVYTLTLDLPTNGMVSLLEMRTNTKPHELIQNRTHLFRPLPRPDHPSSSTTNYSQAHLARSYRLPI